MRSFAAVAALMVLGAVALLAGPDKKIYSNDYLGVEPPARAVVEGHWFNSEKAPSLKELQGRVVWLEFSFMG